MVNLWSAKQMNVTGLAIYSNGSFKKSLFITTEMPI